jgi:hypothetical protein
LIFFILPYNYFVYANLKMLYTIKNGIKYAFKDELYHSADLPAVVHPSGHQEWWLEGQRHRSKGPAVVFEDGGQEWWKYGEKHRLNGPAVSYANGHKEWWVYGKLHRLEGPAVEYNNGKKEWWEDGEFLYAYDDKNE